MMTKRSKPARVAREAAEVALMRDGALVTVEVERGGEVEGEVAEMLAALGLVEEEETDGVQA